MINGFIFLLIRENLTIQWSVKPYDVWIAIMISNRVRVVIDTDACDLVRAAKSHNRI